MNQTDYTTTSAGLEPQMDPPVVISDSQVSVQDNVLARPLDTGAVSRGLKLPTHLVRGNWQIELGAMVLVCLLALGCSLVAKDKVDKLSQENESLKAQVSGTGWQLRRFQQELFTKSQELDQAYRENRAQRAIVDDAKARTTSDGPDVPAQESDSSGRFAQLRSQYLRTPGINVQIPGTHHARHVSQDYDVPLAIPLPGPSNYFPDNSLSPHNKGL